MILKHKFVDNIPDGIEDGIVYISIPFETVIHKCCCGCGNEVVTPLSPVDWSVTFNGESISLEPSIGNWSFKCHSHYWITKNKVIWSTKWNNKRIEEVRKRDFGDRNEYFGDGKDKVNDDTDKSHDHRKKKKDFWKNLFSF